MKIEKINSNVIEKIIEEREQFRKEVKEHKKKATEEASKLWELVKDSPLKVTLDIFELWLQSAIPKEKPFDGEIVSEDLITGGKVIFYLRRGK